MRWALLVLLFSRCVVPDPDPQDGGREDARVAPGEDAGRALPAHERYISSSTDARLVIELDYVEGALPRAAAEADLIARLTALLDKPGGIEIVHDDVIPSRGADHAWTFAELTMLADQTFDDDHGTIAMHVLWIDGHDDDDGAGGSILGLAWGNRHIAMYHDTIERICGSSLIMREQVCESAQYHVWLHEVGHVIGLVDNGLPMVTDHRDPDHGAHDVNDACIMYWAFDGESGIDILREQLLGGGPTIDFDAECLADIAAVRDR